MASDRTVLLALAQTLTNKTLTSPKLNEDVAVTATATEINRACDGITSTATELNQLDGVSVGGSSAGDIATIDDTQTLTNKTLTSPKLNEDVALSATATELNQLDGVAVGGTSSGDIVDLNTAQTLSNKTITLPVIASISDGTYTIAVPTNGMAAAKFMLGTSDTVAWFYNNTAPPGWKVTATGADTVLAVSGGSDAYNVNGGNPDSVGDWTTNWNHQLTVAEMPAHTHGIEVTSGSGGTSLLDPAQAPSGNYTLASTGSTGGDGTHNHGRPAASVGKLFQLDTA